MTKNKLQTVPFVNKIGQTIEVGDKVVVVSTGYSHQVKVRQGVYSGLVNGKPSATVTVSKFGYLDGNGKDVGWQRSKEKGVKPARYSVQKRVVFPVGRIYAIV